MTRPRIVIIGGGFAGLTAAKILKKADADILLLDKTNQHLFQPLLYQVATAALAPSNIAAPIRDILKKSANTSVLLADIVAIDKHNKKVIARNGDAYGYDYLILAPGSRHSYFGHPEWETLAPGLKTTYDAITIRENIFLSYERAERCNNAYEAEKFMRFVIVGGGPTGVELAGALAEIAHQSLKGEFRRINPGRSKIYLIEGDSQILPGFPADLSEKAKGYLEKLGVEVLVNTRVTDITSQGVWMNNQCIETQNVIWAAGNQASPLLKTLDTPLDKAGRALVNPDLSIPHHPEIFVVGDAAYLDDKNGQPLPGIAPVAIQQGKYVAKLIRNKIPFEQRSPFSYIDKGMIATIGQSKAVGVIGKKKISGFFAWMIWGFVHIFYLITYANRLFVMIQWIYLYLFHQRRIRLITRPISENDQTF